MAWIITAFLVGVAAGILLAKVFFPNLCVKYKVIEKEVEKKASK